MEYDECDKGYSGDELWSWGFDVVEAPPLRASRASGFVDVHLVVHVTPITSQVERRTFLNNKVFDLKSLFLSKALKNAE
jgi:hypothetical protein